MYKINNYGIRKVILLYKAVIVEDDAFFRQELATVISSTLDIEVVCTFSSGEEFLMQINKMHPDILFLDIGLPGISGIQVAESVREDYPYMEIILITADEHYLQEAVRLYASDFITKPLDIARLNQTMSRIMKKSLIPGLLIELKTTDSLEILRQEEICFVEAMAKKSIIYTMKKPLTCLHLIRELEERLDKRQFFRSNRSYLVNLRWIDAVRPTSRTTFQITFQGIKESAYLQKKRYPEFRERLKLFLGEGGQSQWRSV